MKYEPFYKALDAGTAKIDDYYQKTADSDAYTFSMRMFLVIVYSASKLMYCMLVLNPTQKANHVKKYWGKDLYSQTIKEAEDIVSFPLFHSSCYQLRSLIVQKAIL